MKQRLNLHEMNEALPNGLHDAEVGSFTYDLQKSTVTYHLNLWVGTMEDPEATRERYRRGTLCFTDAVLFTKTESAYQDDGRMTILTWSLEEALEEKRKLTKAAGLFL